MSGFFLKGHTRIGQRSAFSNRNCLMCPARKEGGHRRQQCCIYKLTISFLLARSILQDDLFGRILMWSPSSAVAPVISLGKHTQRNRNANSLQKRELSSYQLVLPCTTVEDRRGQQENYGQTSATNTTGHSK